MEKNLNEMTFEELVILNEKLNDKRTKAFRTLKDKLINVYVPSLRQALKNAEMDHVLFKLYNQPYSSFDKCRDYHYDEFYLLGIDSEDENALEGCVGTTAQGYEEYKMCNSGYSEPFEKISNNCIIELVKQIKRELRDINEAMLRQIKTCNELTA